MLGRYKVGNNVRVTLHTAISAVSSSIVVDAATGVFNNPPDPTGDTASNGTGIASITDSLTQPTKTEIFTFTSVTDNGNGTFTLGGVTRGQDGTVGQSFAVGAIVMQAMTTGQLAHPYLTPNQAAGTLGVGVPTTVTGSLTQQDAAASGFRALLAAGALKFAKYVSGWKDRWSLVVSGTESGSNAGSDLSLASFNDAGASLSANVLTLNRATGNVCINVAAASATDRLTVGGAASANSWVGTDYIGCRVTLTGFGLVDALRFMPNASTDPTAYDLRAYFDSAHYNSVISVNPTSAEVTIPLLLTNNIKTGTTPSATPLLSTSISVTGVGSITPTNQSILHFSSTTVGPSLALGKGRGTPASQSLVLNGDRIGDVSAYGARTSADWTQMGIMRWEADGAQTTSSMPCRLVFSLTPSGSVSPTEVVRFNNDGSVTIQGGLTVEGDSLVSNGIAFFNSTLYVQGAFVRNLPQSLTAPTTTTNNLAISSDASAIRLTGTGGGTLTGIVAPSPVSGREITIFNTTSGTVTLAHDSTSSSIGNRFYCPGNSSLVIAANDSVSLWYDPAGSAHWRVKR